MDRSLYFAFVRPSYIMAFVILILSGFTGTAYSLTADEVRALKKAGVSDETIQIMLQQEREAKAQGPHDQMGVREIKDNAGNTYIVYSTGKSGSNTSDAEKERVEKAWRMLQNIIIDRRH